MEDVQEDETWGTSGMGWTIVASFIPQAHVGEVLMKMSDAVVWAVSEDAWDNVTASMDADTFSEMWFDLRRGYQLGDDGEFNALKNDPSAPNFVQSWRGRYVLYVHAVK